METIILDELGHDGIWRMKVLSDLEIRAEVYQARAPSDARARVEVTQGRDDLVGLFSLELCWPVFGMVDVMNFGPMRFRRLLFVHFSYAKRVSECIKLGAERFLAGTKFLPGYAFVRNLPGGAEDLMDVHGCVLTQAEWMPADCVALGGSR